ncbi:hypothetical protein J5277_26445 [Rhizobium sp. 16-449-1b]|nr:hypothetical protein [Rhizobium sp. 16-449-1b]
MVSGGECLRLLANARAFDALSCPRHRLEAKPMMILLHHRSRVAIAYPMRSDA